MYDVQYLLIHSNFELSLGQCLPGSFTLSIDTISILVQHYSWELTPLSSVLHTLSSTFLLFSITSLATSG